MSSTDLPRTTGNLSSESTDVYLFNPEKLTKLSSWSEIKMQLEESNLIARPLKLSDYQNGYIELLRQLTVVGTVYKENFEDRFQFMKLCNEAQEHYVIVVIEDMATKQVVGASSLQLELKFIHECSIRGRLEDVVIHDQYRGKQIGKLIVRIIVGLAKETYNCYKLSLDCRDELVEFYGKNGFKHEFNMLCIPFYKQ